MLAGQVDDDGELERADEAFAADAVGTIAGAALGTSPVTNHVESSTGIEEGGRSGLMAVVVALPLLPSLFFVPLVVTVPALASAPALIVVGALMMRGARELDWARIDVALLAFLTVAAMPFTYSLANGISSGIASWVWIQVLAGRGRDVHPVMFVLCGLVMLFYGLGIGW